MVRRTQDLDAPDGEKYRVVIDRWAPPWIGAGALVSLVVSLARRRWSVIVHRDVQAKELRARWLPYAYRWHGPAMRQRDVDAEFERVITLIGSGRWPDPTYVQR